MNRRKLRFNRLEDRLAPALATWDGGGIDNKWTTVENWIGDVAPQSGDDLSFAIGANRSSNVNDFATGIAFNSLAIHASDYQLAGNAIALTAGVSADFLSGTSELNLAVSGGGGLTKLGGGTLLLRGANSYSGLTDVHGGVLEARSGTALGAIGLGNDTAVHDGAALALSGDISIAEAIAFSGGTIIPNPGQAISLSPIRVFSGNPTLSGPLTLTADASVATAVLGKLTITGAVGQTGPTRDLSVYGNIHFTTTSTVGCSLSLISGTTICDGQAGLVELAPLSTTGEVLGGTGHIGPVVVRDGVIDPGVGGPGVLTTGDLDMGDSGANHFRSYYHVDLTGSGGQFFVDRLDVHGSVLLREPQLTIAAATGLILPSALHIPIISNDGTDPVANTFAFLPEGSIVQTINHTPLRITYHGGDGNDVELYTGTGGRLFADAFVDSNRNGRIDSVGHAGEQLFPGVAVYVDLNRNGQLDPGEPSGQTEAQFDFLADGTYLVRCGDVLGAPHTSPTAVDVVVSGGGFFSADFGFDITTNSSGAQEFFAVGAGEGGVPHVQVMNADGSVRFDFLAYDARFRGGVRVATADVTGDQVEDIITAPGPGGGPHIKIFDGRTGAVVREWMAYDPAFTGGVYVAAWRDRNSQSGEIITGAGPGGGPHVRLWNASTGTSYRDIFPYDPNFRGGVTVAIADLNGGSFPEIITGAGPGGGPHVEVFDGDTYQVIRSFFAYEPEFRGGVFVAAMDTNHDFRTDIVTGAGAGGGPLVKSFDWFNGQALMSFFAYDPAFRGGVRVGVTTIPHQFDEAIAVAAGPGGGPHVRVLNLPSLTEAEGFFVFDPAFVGGVFVG